MATLLSRRSSSVGVALTAFAALVIGCGGGGGGNNSTTTGTAGTNGTGSTSSGSTTSGAAGSIGGGTDGGTGALAGNTIYYTVADANSGYDVKYTKEDGTGTGTYATGLSADNPAASPDPSSSGKLVFAYAPTTNGSLGIYRNSSVNTTGATTLVTPRYSEVDSLMVSRDGKKVVFVAATATDSTPHLYVVATTGSGTPTLLDGDEILSADLSSTGNIVVYEKLPATGSTTLFVRDLTATAPVQLTQSDGRDRDEPQFSKDGKEVVFSQDDGTGRHTLAYLSAVGGAITTVDPFPGTAVSVRAPSFNGDGTRLVFVAEGSSTTNTGLFTCDLAGANLVQVPNTVAPLPLRSLYWTNAGGRAAGSGLSLHLNRPRAKK